MPRVKLMMVAGRLINHHTNRAHVRPTHTRGGVDWNASWTVLSPGDPEPGRLTGQRRGTHSMQG